MIERSVEKEHKSLRFSSALFLHIAGITLHRHLCEILHFVSEILFFDLPVLSCTHYDFDVATEKM